MFTDCRIQIHDAGTMPYAKALEWQRSLADSLIQAKKNNEQLMEEHLIMLEHYDVYTLGRHAKESNLLFPEDFFRSQGAEVVKIDRGGDVTYHGPGQLVVYPIIDMELHNLGVKDYVHFLEQCVIDLLEKYGIKGKRVDGATGVWLDAGTPSERKICAIGIKCTRFITMHGLALNVNTDLSKFSLINPCGFKDKGVTSISAECGKEIDLNDVKNLFALIFIQNLFGEKA